MRGGNGVLAMFDRKLFTGAALKRWNIHYGIVPSTRDSYYQPDGVECAPELVYASQ